MEFLKFVQQKSSRLAATVRRAGPSGYELQISRNGLTETWKGKVRYYGKLEMQDGTYFHQLRFLSPTHPVMYLNFVFPKDKVFAEGGYTFCPVPYEESGSLKEAVTEFYLPGEDGFPEPALQGFTRIQLGRNGYAIAGDLKAKIAGGQKADCQLKCSFWLDEWGYFPVNRLSTLNFT